MNKEAAGVNISLCIEPSGTMLIFLITTQLFAITGIWMADLNVIMALALVLAILCYGFYSYQRFYRLTHGMSVLSMRMEGKHWILGLSNNRQVRVMLVREVVVFSWFIAVQFQSLDDRQKYAVALFSDSAQKDALRRLRVWLKHGAAQSAQDGFIST